MKKSLFILLPILVFLYIVFVRKEIFTEWDGIVYFFPSYHHISNALFKHESLAFADQWFSGNPFLADYQTGTFSPYTIVTVFLTRFLSQEVCFSLIATLSLIVLIWGYYHLLGLFTENKNLRVYLALCTGFLGHFYYQWGHTVTFGAISFSPWILYHGLQYLFEKKKTSLVPMAIFFGLQILCGSPYIWFALGFALSLIAIFVKRTPLSTLALLLFLALGVGLSAIQLGPFIELIKLSERSHISMEEYLFGSYHPFYFIKLLFPYFFGGRKNFLYNDNYFGNLDAESMGIFLGFLPLCGLLLGIFYSLKFYRKSPVHVSVLICFLIFLFLSVGRYFVLSYAFYYLPGFGSLRLPSRHIAMMTFFAWPLIATGLDRLYKRTENTLAWKFPGYACFFLFLAAMTLVIPLIQSFPNYPLTMARKLSFALPFIGLFMTMTFFRFRPQWLFLFLFIDSFVLHCFDFRGLVNINTQVPSLDVKNYRVLLPQDFIKATDLHQDYPTILGYSSLERSDYREFWNVKRVDMVDEDFCKSFNKTNLNMAAIKYALFPNPPCLNTLRELGEERKSLIEFPTKFSILDGEEAEVKSIEPIHSLFKFRKKITMDTHTKTLIARYFYFPGMSAYAIDGKKVSSMNLVEKKPYYLKFESENPSSTFVFEYSIPRFEIYTYVTLGSLGLLLVLGIILLAVGDPEANPSLSKNEPVL